MDSDRFRGLIAIQQAIGTARGDLQAVMAAIVGSYAVMPQSNGIVIELREGDQLYYAAASGTSGNPVGMRLPLEGSLSGRSILSGEALYCADSETDPRVNLAACRRVGLRSMIVVPIKHQGETAGVLKYHSDKVAAFDEEDMLMAHLLAGPIAQGLANVGEADAQRAETELRSILRLKDQLVSTVSHELRTPLTSIAGSLGLLAGGAGGALPEAARALIAVAARNADRLKNLVNDLLDMDRVDSGRLDLHLMPVDLVALLGEVVEANEPFARELGVTLRFDPPQAAIAIDTDPDRLIQAVTNLVSNAAKFSPRGGMVTIALDRTPAGARIRVADEGPGIPDDFRPRLFDRFAQSERTRGLSNLPGTGLGLAIAKGIVDRLGGEIALDETVARGAAFDIRLPIAAPGSAEAAA